MPRRLSEEQIGAYARDGVLFPIRVLPAEEARSYREACDLLESDLGGKPRTIEVRQMHLHFVWAFELATLPTILDAVQDILGPNLLIWATELFTKHPQDATVSIAWHRDQPYLGLVGGRSVTAWVALSRSIASNGCMRVLTRAAESIVTPMGEPRLVKPASDSDPHLVDVALNAGEMSLHDADILHGSGPSRSAEKRVGFVIRFITPDAKPVHGKPPVLLARGVDAYQHFASADPPIGAETNRALNGMRASAVQHFDAVLENLKRTGP